jgi:lipopolysaccharide transport system ATP-binding protein
MIVRLGFAIAAHLEPEILVVDEVLAVGDAEFQKKAIGKMQDVSKGEGRTVLFVSHNMAAVRSLCTRGILLKNGTVDYMGTIPDTINQYLEMASTVKYPKIIDNIKWIKNSLKISNIEINGTTDSYSVIKSRQKTLNIKIEGYTDETMLYDVMVVFRTKDGIPLASYCIGHNKGIIKRIDKGNFSIEREIELPKIINKGRIMVELNLHHPKVEWQMQAPNCCIIDCLGDQIGLGDALNIKEYGFIGLDNYTDL